MARRGRKGKDSLAASALKKLIKGILSVVVLTAFVLGIGFFVKEAGSLDSSKIAKLSSPILSKTGINEEQLGEVAGAVMQKFGDIDIEGISDIKIDKNSDDTKDTVLKIAVLADSHIAKNHEAYDQNVANLKEALDSAKQESVDYVFHVGDLTNFGELADLEKIKDVLDASGLSYEILPGDRDLAATLDASNVISVFGGDRYLIDVEGYTFILLNNSANYTELSDSDMSWFASNVGDADFVVLSRPLYASNDLYMGSADTIEDDPEKVAQRDAVKEQRDILLSLIRSSDVKAVIAGDHHVSRRDTDPEKNTLSHFVVGATAESSNEYPQAVLQSQRYSLLTVYDDSSYEVKDIEL